MNRKNDIFQTAKETARELRNNPTNSEQNVWQILKNRNIEKYKFLRQHPLFFNSQNRIYFFIPDFFCYELQLVIEIDGSIHNKQIEYDKSRDELFNSHDIHVLRIKNEDTYDAKKLGHLIKSFIKQIKTISPLDFR